MAKSKSVKKKVPPDSITTKIFLLKSDGLKIPEGSDENPSIIVLRHPKTNEGARFLLSADGTCIQEILSFFEEKRSWFVDKSTVPSGRMYISTPMDPLFLALPYLKKTDRCSPLDDVINDEEYPETCKILQCSGLKNISQIADSKGDPSLNAYLYNETKTLSWLQKKARKVACILQKKGTHVGNTSAVSANFVKTENNIDSEDSYLRYACGIVSDYLSDDLHEKLLKSFNLLTDAELKLKRKEITSPKSESNAKKIKVEEPCDVSFTPPVKEKIVKQSAKEKARAKAAVGSKSISSFFKKK